MDGTYHLEGRARMGSGILARELRKRTFGLDADGPADVGQSTDNFLRCLENAFQHFGGVPKTLVVDNLKAAVIKADWFDPELNPKLLAFCEHYGTVVLPTKVGSALG